MASATSVFSPPRPVERLHGWDVSDRVIDDARLLTTELMSHSVEHGPTDR